MAGEREKALHQSVIEKIESGGFPVDEFIALRDGQASLGFRARLEALIFDGILSGKLDIEDGVIRVAEQEVILKIDGNRLKEVDRLANDEGISREEFLSRLLDEHLPIA